MNEPRSQFNKNLISLLFTVFIDFVGFGIILPIVAPVLLDPASGVLSPGTTLATREFVLGLVIAAFPAAQFFAAPMLGVLSDKHGRKKILLLSIGGTAVSNVLFAVGVIYQSMALIFLSRILNGITGGNVSIAQSAMADMSEPQSRARNFGLIGMAFGLGFVLGPFIGGKLADPHTVSWFNYATPFWFAGLLSLLNVLLIWFWFQETLKTPARDVKVNPIAGFDHIRRAISHPGLRTIFSVVFLSMFGFTFFTQFFQVYLIEKFQYTQAQLGMLYGYIGLWIAVTQGGVTRILSRRVSSMNVLRVSILMLSIGLIALLIPEQPLLLYAVLPIVALSQGTTMPNITALVSNSVGMEEQGEILGINQSVQSVAFAVPPIIAGIVSSIDVRMPIVLASAFAFLAWITYMIFYKPPMSTVSGG